MVTSGLLVRLEARHEHERAVEELLRTSRPQIEAEPGIRAWFPMQYGRGRFAIFSAFEDDAARESHVRGTLASLLESRARGLLSEEPQVDHVDLLGVKLPSVPSTPAKALLLTFHAQHGHEADVASFLQEGEQLVQQEQGTTAWFGFHCRDIRPGAGAYGIFDVFADNTGSFAHITGRVPRGLARGALNLLRDFPEIHMVNLLAPRVTH